MSQRHINAYNFPNGGELTTLEATQVRPWKEGHITQTCIVRNDKPLNFGFCRGIIYHLNSDIITHHRNARNMEYLKQYDMFIAIPKSLSESSLKKVDKRMLFDIQVRDVNNKDIILVNNSVKTEWAIKEGDQTRILPEPQQFNGGNVMTTVNLRFEIIGTEFLQSSRLKLTPLYVKILDTKDIENSEVNRNVDVKKETIEMDLTRPEVLEGNSTQPQSSANSKKKTGSPKLFVKKPTAGKKRKANK